MRRLAWRSARTHAGQFLFTTLAVALAVTFLSGTLALGGTLTEALSSGTAATLKADLYISGQVVPGTVGRDGVVTQPVDSFLADAVSRMDGVAAAYPYTTTTVTLLGTDGRPVDLAATTTTAVPLYDRGQTMVAGSRPTGRDQIALDSHTMSNSGLEIGDSTRLVINGTASDVTVVGEFFYDSETPGSAYVGLDPQWIMEAAASDGRVSSIAIYLADGASAQSVTSRISSLLPAGERVLTREQAADEQNTARDTFLGYIQAFILVFVILAMCMGAFIIMNTFAMNVRQRQNEFALLRAIGVAPSSILGVILAQAAVIGLIGSILGISLGMLLANGIVVLLRYEGLALSADAVIVPVTALLVSLCIGVALTFAGALLPARRAAFTAPVEAMRDSSGAREGSSRAYGYASIVLIVLGTAAVVAARLMGNEELGDRATVFGAGAGAIVLGLVVASPVIARPVMTLLGLPLRLIRPGGYLAVRSLNAFSRRTSATAAALMIGMALVSAGTTVAYSMHESIHESVHESMYADLVVRQTDTSNELHPLPADMVRQISDLEDVESTTAVSASLNTLTEPDGSQITEYLAVVDPKHYLEFYDPGIVDGSVESLDASHVAAFASTGLKVGDRVEISGPSRSVNATVSALVEDNAGITGKFLASPELAKAVGSWTSASTRSSADPNALLTEPLALFITTRPDADAEHLQSQIEQIIAPTYTFTVVDPHELSEIVGQRTNDMLTVLYVLLALSIVIAVLGVLNTLVLSVAERTREIGLMRAVGLGRAQLVGQVICESILTAVYGAVLGGATGIALAVVLRSILTDQGVTMLVIPWGRLLYILLAACAMGIVAALWPALRATRLPVLEAVAAE